MLSGCLADKEDQVTLSERDHYLKSTKMDLNSFKQFNFTSVDSELYHRKDRIDLIQSFHIQRIRENPEGLASEDVDIRIQDTLAGYERSKNDLSNYLQDLYEGIDPDASMYFVSYRNEDGEEFVGYYLIKEGRLLKKVSYSG